MFSVQSRMILFLTYLVYTWKVEIILGQEVTTGTPLNHHQMLMSSVTFETCMNENIRGNRVLEWQSNIEGKHVSIEWTYGNVTCDSEESCFGIEGDETALEPQLVPVQIQEGQEVRFYADEHLDGNFSIKPHWVTEEDFKACKTKFGLPVISQPVQDEFPVAQKFLRTGDNYFIVNTWDPIFKCEYGLRLNVTVKREHCHQPGQTEVCNGRGRCLTSHYDDHFHCECCPGFSGPYCEDVDACINAPCLNQGECIDELNDPTGTRFTCKCAFGFYGDICENHVENLCEENPCLNNSTCEGDSTNYTCHCNPGYLGLHCEENVNECDSSPCIHGFCKDGINSFQCFCEPEYGGKYCERKYSKCLSRPCKNGGFCSDTDDGGYTCHCGQGYTGEDCLMKINLCDPLPCYNATECIDHGNTFSCTCNPGFSGTYCEINIDDCVDNPCRNGGSCVDRIAHHTCICMPGTTGKNCETVVRKHMPHPHHMATYPDFGGNPHSHIHNLLIIAGTLAGALLIAMSVLVGCYCRLYGVAECCSLHHFKYKKHSNKDSAVDTSIIPEVFVNSQAHQHVSSSSHVNAAYQHSDSGYQEQALAKRPSSAGKRHPRLQKNDVKSVRELSDNRNGLYDEQSSSRSLLMHSMHSKRV